MISHVTLCDLDFRPVFCVGIPYGDWPTLIEYDGRYYVFEENRRVYWEKRPYRVLNAERAYTMP